MMADRVGIRRPTAIASAVATAEGTIDIYFLVMSVDSSFDKIPHRQGNEQM